jgi:hypothetical protein
MKFISAFAGNTKNMRTDSKIVLNNCSVIVCCSGDIPTEEGTANEPAAPDSVCAFCKNDFQGVTLNKISAYPICDSCKVNLDKKIFPLWVKLFFAGVIFIVVFSMFWNWRFYKGYIDIGKANRAFTARKVSDAATLMENAAADVPEVKEISALASYFKAVDLLQTDKSTEALAVLDNCKDLPPDFHINQLVLQAEMGSGFDKKDYNLFLTSSKALLQLDSTKADAWASVSSAYACLYSQNGSDSAKALSIRYLNRAKKLDDTSADAKEYLGRILYRLDSKQIISKDEFDKKFPNGYTSNSLK